jgi:hypothetical protein
MRLNLITAISGLYLVLLSPIAAQPAPIHYKIDFVTTAGVGSVAPVVFTYDPTTEFFTGLTFVWTFDGHSDGFGLTGCSICVIDGFALPNGVNDFPSAKKEDFLANLLAGGTWAAADGGASHDSAFSIGGVSVFMVSGGSNTTASASGVFGTTNVPEPSSLFLLASGLLGVVLVKRTTSSRRSKV